jgi:hypothetical protein
MVSAPKAPDPVKTANAQAGLNRDTAITEAQLGMVNQITPDGSLTYNQTGTSSFIDSKGNVVRTPTYTATQTLSPQQQAIKAQTDAASLNLGTLANQQSAAIKDQLSNPFEFNNSDAEQWAYDLASPRILQQQSKNESALRSQLIASGIRPGTAAWDSEMSRLTNANTDQLNQLALTGRAQAYQEALTEYNNPLNSINALLSGSQIQNPNFVTTPSPNVAGVDYTGLVNNQYNAQMQQYNSQMGALGGLFKLGAGFAFSDRRLKKDIVPMGERNGLPWYVFRYIWEDAISPLSYGFMADEIAKVMPEAVREHGSGYLQVNYDMALEGA